MKTKAITLLLSLSLCACSMLKLSEDGQKVRVLDVSDVKSCRLKGKTHTSVTAMIIGIERPLDAISNELQTVARNSAARMNGDTIVALTEIDMGKQTFAIYKCVNPNG